MAIEDLIRCTRQPRSDAFQALSSDASTCRKSLINGCLISVLSTALVLSACGSNSGGQGTQELALLDSESDAPDRTPPLEILGDGDPLLNPVPEFVSTETRADTGIQVAYTAESQLVLVDTAFVEQQWQLMQTCLGLVSPPPLVIIVDGSVTPFTSADDVLFNFDGKINASASVSGSSVVIQIRVADFDGSLGSPGFYLRSIMGRSLWLSAGMAERDYPFACARTVIQKL